MEPIEGSETSAFKPQTPGKYPKEDIPLNEHVESLKSRQIRITLERNLRAQWNGMVLGYWRLLMAFVGTFEFWLYSNQICFSAHPDKYLSRWGEGGGKVSNES